MVQQGRVFMGKNQGEGQQCGCRGGSLLETTQVGGGADRMFQKQLGQASQSLAFFLVEDINLLDVCWKGTAAESKQCRRF